MNQILKNRKLVTFYFENPGSITYTIPSIVREVSAIFVDTIHFLPGMPFLFGPGGGLNILYYYWNGSVEYKGKTSRYPTC